MHILIIPSEEFIPPQSHLAGIFQLHQATVLRRQHNKVGVLSIKQSLSIPMIVRASLLKMLNKKIDNELGNFSFLKLAQTLWQKTFKIKSFITEDKIDEIDVVRINGFYFHKPVENENDFGWVKAGMEAFKYYVRQHGMPDIVHAHNALYAGLLAQKIKSKYGLQYIVTEHSTVYARGLIKSKSYLKKIGRSYSNANALYAVSTAFCDLLNSMFQTSKFRYLPNVLDPFLESKGMRTIKKDPNKFTFLNIAELHPKKDQLTLLKAFSSLSKKFPEIRLVVGGSGELEKVLQEFVIESGLSSKVCFTGSLSREEVYEHLVTADCFILSSLFETFGVVVIEAMLFGKPVIVTKCGGPQSFVEDFTGLVVESNNTMELANAMEKMIVDYGMFNSDRIRNYTLESFGGKQFYSKLMSAYKNALNYA